MLTTRCPIFVANGVGAKPIIAAKRTGGSILLRRLRQCKCFLLVVKALPVIQALPLITGLRRDIGAELSEGVEDGEHQDDQ